MSRIHAKPYIRKVIDSLSDLQKVALLGLVNGETPIGGSANPTQKSLLNPSQYINGGDKNVVKYVALETAEGTYTGFLIYTNAYCCLVAYQDDSQNLDILDIDLSNMTYKVNGENTSIADMRFEIEQSKEKMDVVAYIEEAIQEGDIAIDAANVISLENVDLSEGSDEAVLSAANWILATDKDHECVLNLYLATQNVYPIGDVVELNRIAVSDDEVTFGGTFDYPNNGTYIGYTISAVFTEQSGSIHIVETEANKTLGSGEYPNLHNLTIGGETYVVPEGGANIVEITSADIGSALSEARGAEIAAADALQYGNAVYFKDSKSASGSASFFKMSLNSDSGNIEKGVMYYNPDTRILTSNANLIVVLARSKTISNFSSSKSYSPGDLVYHNNTVYRCVTAHQGSFSNNDFTQVVLANEIHSDIVTISATGVQSDEMAAKILNAKALYYNNMLYTKSSDDGTYIEFTYLSQSSDKDTRDYLQYVKSTKTISLQNSSYNRVTRIGGQSGSISGDASFRVTPGKVAQLTGKLPYLDTLPSTDNTSGFLTIVKCTSEPAAADRREGYLYIVVPSAQ